MPLPARLADAVVDIGADGGVELQREDVGRRQWVALFAPAVAPLTAPVHRALRYRHDRQKEQKGTHTTHSAGRGWVGEQLGVSLEQVFRGLLDQLSFRAALR